MTAAKAAWRQGKHSRRRCSRPYLSRLQASQLRSRVAMVLCLVLSLGSWQATALHAHIERGHHNEHHHEIAQEVHGGHVHGGHPDVHHEEDDGFVYLDGATLQKSPNSSSSN